MFEKNRVGKPSIDKPWLKYYTNEQKNTSVPKMSVYDYLLECNKRYKGRIALNYFNRKITYEELFSHIDEVAAALTQKGVKKGDIITVSLPNIPEAVHFSLDKEQRLSKDLNNCLNKLLDYFYSQKQGTTMPKDKIIKEELLQNIIIFEDDFVNDK